ncbi:MAG TPA: group III truncated hemoglobin [Candidatus Kapabacteria bacterium]|nr:group III truncated hemoglobin [Candidatus Kapabacteria bacterium]
MVQKKDIENLDDIKLLVNTFYGSIREDELLGKIFNDVIQDRWDIHLEKMYRFWQTMLLEDRTYTGRPFVPHAQLPVEGKHFARWVRLFHNTVDSLFYGEIAETAKWRGEKMAENFLSKINLNRKPSNLPNSEMINIPFQKV